ncbi:hypothetical protein ACZ90_31720 [Streptomyces albus subsp. albus]|nr:hypothetical protein ACZ90_31720 [Streptomyces albus subsp. albus]
MQRTVKVANRPIAAAVIEERLRERAAKALAKLPEEDRAAVIARTRELAADGDATVSAPSYEVLVRQIQREVRERRANALAPVESIAVKTGAPPRSTPPPDQMEVELSPDTKITRLAEVRRRLSLVGVQQKLGDFRDRGKGVTGFTYKHTEENKFGIASTSNFLTGGQTGHSYQDLFASAARTSGLTNDQLAKRLINALTSEGNAFAGLEADARQYLTKIVAVIHGAEFRRAAANPTAAVAALNQVVANPGLDIFETLHSHALFAPGGGSASSQFHRRKEVDQSSDDFRERAVREYDALAQLVAVNGFDTADEQAFYTGCEKIGATSMEAFKKTFTYDKA